MSIRYVSFDRVSGLKALQRAHSARPETPENIWHVPLLNDDGGSLPPRGQSGLTQSVWLRFWGAQRKPINTENIFQCAVGALSLRDILPIFVP